MSERRGSPRLRYGGSCRRGGDSPRHEVPETVNAMRSHLNPRLFHSKLISDVQWCFDKPMCSSHLQRRLGNTTHKRRLPTLHMVNANLPRTAQEPVSISVFYHVASEWQSDWKMRRFIKDIFCEDLFLQKQKNDKKTRWDNLREELNVTNTWQSCHVIHHVVARQELSCILGLTPDDLPINVAKMKRYMVLHDA